MKIAIITYAKDDFEVRAITRLTDTAHARGHEVLRLRYQECTMKVQDSKGILLYRGEEVKGIDAVIPWIIQADFQYGMSVLRHCELMGAFVLNSADAFENAADKWRAAQLLTQAGVPTPITIRSLDHKYIHDQIGSLSGEQSILKITHGTRGNGVMLAHDRETAESIADTLSICKNPYIVQEFIAEAGGRDTRAYIVGDRVIASMERCAQAGFRSNLHLGASGKEIQLDENEKNVALIAAKALGLRSAGVDLIRDRRGLLVIEANASGEFGIELITGCDLAKPIIEYVEQNAKRRPEKDKIGA